MDSYRVWADIDLDAFASNMGQIRARVGPDIAIMLVVKADAYGHGAVAISHCALRHGACAFGVGTSAEALELRRSGIRSPILVLGTIVDDEATACLVHEIEVALHSADRCQMLEDLAARLDLVARVHLKIDTGMGRLGVLPERALPLLEQIRASRHMKLCGVMTHISSPLGTEDEFTAVQMGRFREVIAEARARKLLSGWIHAANSACVFTGLDPLFDAVRPGISAYGVLPEGLPGASDLEPVMSLRSQVVFLKDLAPGSPVGYGGTWTATGPTRLATLPIGYNDGVPWRLGNNGAVLVRGRRAPIVGRVSMDYTTIDVAHIPGVSVGDRVTLFGRDGGETISLEEVAQKAGTIPYEIACSVGRRVERIFRGGHGVLAPRPRTETEQPSALPDRIPPALSAQAPAPRA